MFVSKNDIDVNNSRYKIVFFTCYPFTVCVKKSSVV